MSQNVLLTVTACVAMLGIASAQSFNIDVGTSFPTPASTFGGAAGQPGAWNAVAGGSTSAVALVDLAGAPTAVTIQRTSGSGADVAWNNPSTSGDDAALMDDGDDPGASSLWTIAGLAAGEYVVTTYAWAPDDPGSRTNVNVLGGGPAVDVGGPWPGGYVVGITHAVANVNLLPGADLSIVIRPVDAIGGFGTFNGVQIHRETPPYVVSCPGDGSAAPCPCGNSGATGNGCANSSFAAGARLAASGTFSVASDTGALQATNVTGTSAIFYQGDALAPPFAVDDGLACVSGAIIRLGERPVVVNATLYPWTGDPSLSVRGAIPPAGGTRHYQCFYRNAAVAFCPPATSNRTNGVTVVWVP